MVNHINTAVISIMPSITVLGEYTEESLMFYPDRESQLQWIRWYLEYRAELCGESPQDVQECQIALMYRGVTLYAQVCGIYVKNDVAYCGYPFLPYLTSAAACACYAGYTLRGQSLEIVVYTQNFLICQYRFICCLLLAN